MMFVYQTIVLAAPPLLSPRLAFVIVVLLLFWLVIQVPNGSVIIDAYRCRNNVVDRS